MSKNDNLLCGQMPPQDLRPLKPFDERVLAFLTALSAALLKDREAKAYPDVITFGFFCRRANLEALRREYDGQLDDRLGRGVAFHIAPSNVPVNFAYSLTAALLAGNGSVVKASSKDFPQTRMIARGMDCLLAGEYADLSSYCCVLTYPREEQALTEKFCAQCNVRIIWGGDETVRRVREAPIAPRAFDVTFADRYSLACLSVQAILQMDERAIKALAQDFYNDTYLTDQNACTSPRLMLWVGTADEARAARERFWNAVHEYTAPRYPLEPVVAVDKLTAACRAAIEMEGARMIPAEDNLITRVEVMALSSDIEKHRCPGGFFVEYVGDTLDALKAIADERYQTLAYAGFEPQALKAFVTENRLRGIDRVVPIGHTMDFALTWDGYDLIRTLSRRVGMI